MELWAIEYQLVNSAPEYVFDWLENNVEDDHVFGERTRQKLEVALMARNDKLINLGLALYSEVSLTGYELFKSEDPVIKRAALSGRSIKSKLLEKDWVFKKSIIAELIEDDKQRNLSNTNDGTEVTLLHELLKNKFIPVKLLKSIYDKSGFFSDIDEETWIRLVGLTTRNKRISTPYSSIRLDGADEFLYNEVFTSAWGLFTEFPVNIRAAYTLMELGDRLVPVYSKKIKIFKIIDRWRSIDKNKDEKYSYIRSHLVKLIADHGKEFKKLKNHDDLAVRRGYYAGIKHANVSDITEGFEKDGIEFLNFALDNDAFYYYEEIRRALHKLCWKTSNENDTLTYVNICTAREKFLSTKNIEWFKDSFTGEYPFEEISDPDERQEKRLKYLSYKVSELHEALLGKKEEYQTLDELGKNSQIKGLKTQIQHISDISKNLDQKISYSWVWVIVGTVLGFILGRY